MRFRSTKNRRGSIQIEFALVASTVLIPLILGLMTLGMELIRATMGVQVTRDVGHMFARGTDFSLQANQDLLATHLADTLSLKSNSGNVTGGSSGNGVIVLTALTMIGSTCPACPNHGHVVVTRRIVIGNNTVYTTPYGAPGTIDASTGDVKGYATDTTARADNVSSIITLNDGDIAWLVETYFSAPDLALPGYIGTLGAYSYAVF